VRRRAEQEVRLADLRLRAAEQVSSAYASEVVSAMRENLDLGNRAYQAGQIDFTQLLLIRRESLEAQRGYVDALEELNSARSELDRAVGREMP
jgi:cobalt-zinc-cadmium efflux system outer membrane protein